MRNQAVENQVIEKYNISHEEKGTNGGGIDVGSTPNFKNK